MLKSLLPVPSLVMLEGFQRLLAESDLIPGGSRVLVGYSGGSDSTALLHLLQASGIDVVAAHLHHGQRPEAEDELKRCQVFAESLGVPFMAGRADVPRMSKELGIGIEEAGREARYGFFREGAFRMECSLIATAHTLTDNVETILLNIVRGSGLSGLAGIPRRRDNIVRPLIDFTRTETSEYCRQNQFWTHDDPANIDLAYSRARIRSKVVPELKAINPGFDSAMLRLSAIADEEDRFLNGMAAAALEQAEIELNGALRFLTVDVEMQFDRQRIMHLPAVLQRRAVRLACEALGAPLSFEQTHAAVDGIMRKGSGSITADGGEVVLEWGDGYVDSRRLMPSAPFRYGITIPGETLSEEFGWQFTAFEAPPDDTQPERASLATALDSAQITGPLHFRTMKPGDSMQPLGFSGRRKLADLLSEAKLTQAARTRLPIVCDMIGPIWAPGVCLDERARPTASTTRVIMLRFGTVGP